MLITVCLPGIVLSLATPLFGAQNDVFADIKAKRNAQELVTECQAAQAAGVHFIVANDVAPPWQTSPKVRSPAAAFLRDAPSA